MTGDWMRDERPRVAAERILDVAAQLYVENGINAVGMAEVARAAGCSRATLYRYFDSRQALQLAFVHREARRIGALIAQDVSGTADPQTVIVEAMLTAIRLVRRDPTLAAWFQLGDSGLAAQIAHSSEVIESLGAAFLGQTGVGGEETSRRARWLVRVIVSLLTVPGVDDDDERAMIEQFVAPVIAGPHERDVRSI
ncbi:MULTISPECIES: TetR/AcrR family transcriptional regulator [Rhodococcus]|uniref:TetR/AcrR family transcriptional regulator n=1 Tax=Rhodococcus oxybenzonivorans TaxID=1990687 RepID=A0AAE5A5Q1_9NOCA|nr:MULTISPECIES: TetR/AcrR family transcriptional regulator [Rhodococcus]MDV7244001.1 TetR/AcrR family transcriptional regulator [Rhodococcus oxybenzonivorans]MDV7263739.1 TetR/AcrR family transcriptional regulator [Rhodococcus oxybenzonivorans]MDV7274757.1 TetR/AcrR family transcriptional regulator [Rhodococcus oxybenzonivorans]MDV7334996.1 TetR/AcrR family transcriptional regulator [Rhodococcus oxybenzonivorans]MDV7345707.1 TetR/AcrR family transcriptional regulator [Rhodococcus oxybenzonivo